MSTIYITEKGVSLKIEYRYLKVFHQNQQCICLPIRNISQFIIFGNTNLPREVLTIIHLHQIPVLYLTQDGEYIGRLENPFQLQPKHLNHQRKHVRNVESNRATSESIIWAKLHNQQVFLQSWTHDHVNHATERALNYLTLLMDNLSIAKSLDELWEYNEEADKVYHYAIASLLHFHKPSVRQISGLLNLGYQLLHQYIYTLLTTAGLHPDYAYVYTVGGLGGEFL